MDVRDSVVNGSHEEKAEQKVPRFVVENGKTYVVDDEKCVFGDFGLKLRGELRCQTGEKCGYWVAACTIRSRGKLETKNIVLPANAFDSRSKFLQELRGRIGCGLINLGGAVTASTLADYYSFLKNDLEETANFTFEKAYHLGFQYNGYWIISRELHVYQKNSFFHKTIVILWKTQICSTLAQSWKNT